MLKLIILSIAFSGILCLTGSYEKIDFVEHIKEAGDVIYETATLKLESFVPKDFKFVKVQRLERQIVAGTNYKYFITYSNGKVENLYSIVIYQDLQFNIAPDEPVLVKSIDLIKEDI